MQTERRAYFSSDCFCSVLSWDSLWWRKWLRNCVTQPIQRQDKVASADGKNDLLISITAPLHATRFSFISLVVLIRFSVRWNFQFVSAALHTVTKSNDVVLLELMLTHTQNQLTPSVFMAIFAHFSLDRIAGRNSICRRNVRLSVRVNRSSDVSFACRITKLRPVNLKGPRRNHHRNNNLLASHTPPN